jgi:hypothetical protein
MFVKCVTALSINALDITSETSNCHPMSTESRTQLTLDDSWAESPLAMPFNGLIRCLFGFSLDLSLRPDGLMGDPKLI